MISTLLALVLLAGAPAGQVVSADAAPTHLIAGGKGQATLLLGAAQGAPAALSLLLLGPGAEVPEHVHETSAEILYVEEGRVEMVVAGQTLRARAGDAIYIPANTPHSAKTLGRLTPLRAVQVYVGPGPEQRFTAGERVERE